MLHLVQNMALKSLKNLFNIFIRMKNFNNNNSQFKSRLLKSFMISGKKNKSELLLPRTAKKFQKKSKKKFQSVFQRLVIFQAQAFKIRNISMKRKKSRASYNFFFFSTQYFRLMSLFKIFNKHIRQSYSSKKYYLNFAQELLKYEQNVKTNLSMINNEVSQKVLDNKRFLSKYKW